MNETMSLLLATAVLAVGGLGLYMYKNNDNQKGGDDSDHYDEDELFNTEYNILYSLNIFCVLNNLSVCLSLPLKSL